MRKVLIGVLLLCLTPQAGLAQSTATATIQPVKWEYLTVIEQFGRMALTDGKTAVTWGSLGDQGWEFVGFHPDNVAGRLLIFKRPRP